MNNKYNLNGVLTPLRITLNTLFVADEYSLMELIRGLHNIGPQHKGCVASIGNFDGVHLGHQQILKRLKALAKTYHLPATVIAFEPHPQSHFQADKAPARITALRDKIGWLTHYQLDRLVVLHFNAALAATAAAEFVQNILVAKLGVKHLVVGDDFHFGYQRKGNFQLLSDLSSCYDYQLECMASCVQAGERISSSRVRALLQGGDCVQAEQLLGHPFVIRGRVQKGAHRGHDLGFPTANMLLPNPAPIAYGIYAVEAEVKNHGLVQGAANVGIRPALGLQEQPLLEVHLLDFQQVIYSQWIRVHFKKRFRDEKWFASLDDLALQIGKDVAMVRAYFKNAGKSNRDNRT